MRPGGDILLKIEGWPKVEQVLRHIDAIQAIGLYDIDPPGDLPGDLIVPDLVAVDPPEALAEFMVERGYIGRGVPLLKRVMALPGQEVCRVRRTITVDGIELGAALDRDRTGRDLPVWQGCRRIAGDEIFLMNPDVRDSLDGRYFGPIPVSAVIGRATPIYTDEDGDGRFVWRAATR
ncbi:S26 family signal peptidase [Brenneria salicis ATCC 15712 = DSM 30166]|nr:S26 family signal peptidase [Brenneria salicis ATCC 15712 = DSM 30166]